MQRMVANVTYFSNLYKRLLGFMYILYIITVIMAISWRVTDKQDVELMGHGVVSQQLVLSQVHEDST